MRLPASLVTLLLLGSLSSAACEREPSPDATEPEPLPPSATASATASASASPVRISRAVFVDQKNRCPCSVEQVKTAWEALQQIATRQPELTVERIQADVDHDRVRALRDEMSYSKLPAIYFVSPSGMVVDLLQGDIDAAQIERAARAGD